MRSRQDEAGVLMVWGFLMGEAEIVGINAELQQSKNMFDRIFSLLQILDKYSLKQRYEGVIISSIRRYRTVGRTHSIEPHHHPHPIYLEVIKNLNSLKHYLCKSRSRNSDNLVFLKKINETIKTIQKEYAKNNKKV